MIKQEGQELRENFPCIFPLSQEISAETGSQQTASAEIILIKTIIYIYKEEKTHT